MTAGREPIVAIPDRFAGHQVLTERLTELADLGLDGTEEFAKLDVEFAEQLNRWVRQMQAALEVPT